MMATRIGVKTAVRAAVFAYGACLSSTTLALGLGEIDMQSFLNEPLRAEVALLDTRRLTVDDIRIRLAGVDDFDRLGVERSYFLTGIAFEVVVDPTTGSGVILLTSEQAVLEPYLDIIIEARWPTGRLLREYTILVDPPAFRQDIVTVSASERVEAANPEKPAVADPPPQASGNTETTGDRVAVRESSLGPGEMPDRAFSAETLPSPRSGSRYMVKRDETLWQIASRGKPDGISVQQAMLDIQRINPEAFINGNINQIKAGYIIYLPSAGEVNSDDLAEAIDEVRAQNREWEEARSAPGVTAAATLRVSAEPSDSTLTEVDSGAAAADRADSSISMRQESGSTSDAMTSDAPQAPAEAEVASAQLAAQLDAMAERLDTLEQIVSLKDQQIATLEQALREAREAAAAAAAAPTPAPTPQVVSTPETAPQQTAPTTPAPAPQQSEPAGSSIPWLPIGGGLLALILGGLFFWRRRSAGQTDSDSALVASSESADEDVFAGVSLKREELEAEEPTEVSNIEPAVEEEVAPPVSPTVDEGASAPPSQGGSRGYGERKNDDYIDEASGGDALAEADIYIAYGRYLQAIELLDTAIENEPANSAYRVKLIELYVDMGEENNAAEQLEELRKHGDAGAIARAEELMGGAVGASDAAPDFELSAEPSAPAPVDSGTDELALDLELESEPAAQPADDAVPDLDIDLPAENDLDGEALSFAKPSTESGPADELDAEPSFDLELQDAGDIAEATGSDVDGDDEINIEFDHLEIEEDSPSMSEDILELGGVDDELDLTDALASEGQEADEADAGEDLMIADDADQMATKLDLARAYLDMGDSDGAKSILQEVAGSGTAEQQQEAQDLLSRIG